LVVAMMACGPVLIYGAEAAKRLAARHDPARLAGDRRQ
jgi:hypothetical protein